MTSVHKNGILNLDFRFPLGKKRYLDVSDFLIEDVSPKKRTREKRQK